MKKSGKINFTDIAERLNFSVSTISKALSGSSDISEKTRDLIVKEAQALGYQPKKYTRTKKGQICIVTDKILYDNPSHFGYEIILAFRTIASSFGYQTSILNIEKGERNYQEIIKGNGGDAAFLLGFSLEDGFLRQLKKTTIPTVLLDNYIKNPFVSYVGTDNFEGIGLSVAHLIELGHKNIALFNGDADSLVSEERFLAYKFAMKKGGIEINPNYIAYGDFYNAEMTEKIVPNFVENGASAIICASDIIAESVLVKLESMGINVPTDMSVVGYDNLPLCDKTTPPLTTVEQNRKDLGQSAFIILQQIMNKVPISKLLLRPRLVVRGSTGRVKTI